MTVTGLINSYGLSAGVPISIDAVIDMLDPTDLPFQNGFMLGGAPALSSFEVDNKKMEWQDDTLLESLSTVNEGGTYSNSDTTLTVADGTRFKAGDVIRIDTEQLYVSAVATNNLTVIRGYAGSTAATHADGSRVLGLGQALPEGSDAVQASHKDRDRRYNMTQIFGPRAVKVSGTEQVMPKYGLARGGEWMYQVMKEGKEMGKAVERSIIYGNRFDDGTDRRTMGGMMYFYTSNVSAATALTVDSVGDQLEAMYNAGATPNQAFILACNLKNKRAVSTIGTVEIQRTDNGRGQVVEFFDTDVGRVQFNVSRYYENADANLYTQDQVSLGDLRPWTMTPLAKTGDADTVMLVCEKTLRVKRERHGAKFNGLTPS